MFLADEAAELAFVKAIDHSLIKDWQHFEYLLSFLLENRFIRIYSAYLRHLNEAHEKERRQVINRKKKQAKKKNKQFKSSLVTIKENIYARLIQKAWRKYRNRKDELCSITEDFAIVDYTFRMERMFGYDASA